MNDSHDTGFRDQITRRVEALSPELLELLARRLADVRAAAARSDDDDGGDGHAGEQTRLVAYVAGAAHGAPGVDALHRHLAARLPDYMIPATFVVLDELPLTATGKVDRNALPELAARAPAQTNGDAETTTAAPRTPRSPAEETLASIWAEVLGFDEVGIDDNFFEMGGDSLLSIRIIARAGQAGLRISPRQFFDDPTVAGMAASATAAGRALVGDPRAAAAERPGDPRDTRPEGEITIPLTPIQHWFFAQDFPERQHWNQAVLLELPRTLDPTLVEAALESLVRRHDALRLRFNREASGWTQRVLAPSSSRTRLDVEDVSDLGESDRASAIESAADTLHTSFDLAEGMLLRAALFQAGRDGQRLLLVAHHLAIDGISWSLLLEDLRMICERLRRGEAVDDASAPSVSFATWAKRLADYARGSPELADDAAYWLALEGRDDGALALDKDGGREANHVASEETLTETLDSEVTRALLQEVPGVYHTQVADALLTALALTLCEWTGRRSVIVDVEGHGREPLFDDLDISRTIGWFTTVFPVALELPAAARDHASPSTGEALRAVKEQLRRVPRAGIGHGLARYLAEDAQLRESFASLPRSDLLFNYLGQALPRTTDSYARVDGSGGKARSSQGRRPYLLEVNAVVDEERLTTVWTFSPDAHRRETVERLARAFHAAIEQIVTHCASPDAGGHTPSDFPLAGLDDGDLDRIARLLGEE